MVSRAFRLSVLAFFMVVGFYTLKPLHHWSGEGRTASHTPNSCRSLPPQSPYIPINDAHFKWQDVPTTYPVTTLKQLSIDSEYPLPKVQHTFSSLSSSALEQRRYRQKEVQKTFQRCWRAYKEKAWLKDELTPVSGGWNNNFGGWAATLVDNLDTLIIMDMHADFEEAVAAAMQIDFGPESCTLPEVNIFETTIRHLGGFLSAYDLRKCEDKRLLEKAIELGEMIYKSFDTPNRMPITRWKPRQAVTGPDQNAADHGIIAELASSSLELTRLSQVTGDMRWFDAIQRVTEVLDEQQNQTSLPGMWPVDINVQAADLRGSTTYSLGAQADSAFEYLIKMCALLGGGSLMEQYKRLYEFAMDTAIRHLLFRPMTPDDADILLPGTATVHQNQVSLDPSVQHLACYVGGMLALGGRLLQNDTHIDKAQKVTQGCVWTYKNSPLGVMPEIFRMFPCESESDCKWNRDQGQWFQSVVDASYGLRPEAIESVFYLYRITGDEALQDVAWNMFQAVEKSTHTAIANSKIHDVTQKRPGKADRMESFWTAETLKYFYLIFSEPDLLSLDHFVFNTEAHAFRRNV